MPQIASTNSRCPFPSTPATPKISPLCRERSTPLTDKILRSSRTCNPLTSSTTAPRFASVRLTCNTTERPTIIWASPASSVSFGEVAPTSLPPRRTTTRSATAITSWSLWVIKTMPTPELAKLRITPRSSSISCGVKTAVGSSRISNLTSLRSAFRISTRCCMPTGRSSMTASGSTSSP